MSESAPQQKAKKSSTMFSAQNHIGVAVLATVLSVVGVVWYGVHAYTSKTSEVKVSTAKINAKTVKAEADAEVSEAYREAKAKQNEIKYQQAENSAGGVAVPFVFLPKKIQQLKTRYLNANALYLTPSLSMH